MENENSAGALGTSLGKEKLVNDVKCADVDGPGNASALVFVRVATIHNEQFIV